MRTKISATFATELGLASTVGRTSPSILQTVLQAPPSECIIWQVHLRYRCRHTVIAKKYISGAEVAELNPNLTEGEELQGQCWYRWKDHMRLSIIGLQCQTH
jgi:hypothetical protein